MWQDCPRVTIIRNYPLSFPLAVNKHLLSFDNMARPSIPSETFTNLSATITAWNSTTDWNSISESCDRITIPSGKDEIIDQIERHYKSYGWSVWRRISRGRWSMISDRSVLQLLPLFSTRYIVYLARGNFRLAGNTQINLDWNKPLTSGHTKHCVFGTNISSFETVKALGLEALPGRNLHIWSHQCSHMLLSGCTITSLGPNLSKMF